MPLISQWKLINAGLNTSLDFLQIAITFFSKMYTGSVISLQIFFLQILINLNYLIRGCLLIINQVPLITGAKYN